MNRLPSFDAASDQHTSTQVAEHPISLCERTPLALQAPHRIFFPQHFESRYQYPLVIWLHSHDSSEYELDEVMPALSLRNYIGIGLRGPNASEHSKRKFTWSLQQESLCVCEEMVLEAAKLAVEDLNVDPQRIFVGGFGAGGSVAQWTALRYPEHFSGAFSINGKLPNLPKLLTNWKQAKHLPVMYMYGTESELCPVDAVTEAIGLSYRCNLNYQFAQFNCGDDLDRAMTSMVNKFVMETSVPVTC